MSGNGKKPADPKAVDAIAQAMSATNKTHTTLQTRLGSGKIIQIALPVDMDEVDVFWAVQALYEAHAMLRERRAAAELTVPSKKLIIPN